MWDLGFNIFDVRFLIVISRWLYDVNPKSKTQNSKLSAPSSGIFKIPTAKGT